MTGFFLPGLPSDVGDVHWPKGLWRSRERCHHRPCVQEEGSAGLSPGGAPLVRGSSQELLGQRSEPKALVHGSASTSDRDAHYVPECRQLTDGGDGDVSARGDGGDPPDGALGPRLGGGEGPS